MNRDKYRLGEIGGGREIERGRETGAKRQRERGAEREVRREGVKEKDGDREFVIPKNSCIICREFVFATLILLKRKLHHRSARFPHTHTHAPNPQKQNAENLTLWMTGTQSERQQKGRMRQEFCAMIIMEANDWKIKLHNNELMSAA